MKKRFELIVFLLLLFCLLPTIALAEENLITEKEIFDGEIVLIRNQTLEININPNLAVQVIHNNSFIVMNSGDCKTKFGLKYCLVNASKDDDDNLIARFKFYEVLADVDVTITPEKSSVYAGEEFSVNISINNAGDNDAVNFNLDFPLGNNITAIQYPDLLLRPGYLFWQGTIAKHDTKDFIITINVNKETRQKIFANISYFDGDDEQNLLSNQETIISDDYLTARFSNSTTSVGEQVILYINFTNHFDSEVFFKKLLVKIPEELEVKYYSDGINLGHNTYEIMDSVAPGANYSLEFRLVPELSGNYTINVTITNLSYVGGNLQTFATTASVKVNKAELELIDDITGDIVVESNQTQRYTIFINNPSENTYFKNIAFRVFLNNMTIAKQDFDRIGADTQITIPLNFLFPEVSQQTSMKINFSIVYESMHGESLAKDLTYNLQLNPLRDVRVRKVISYKEFWYENKSKIEVYVKNEKSQDISQIQVEDILSYGLTKVLGNNKKTISLSSNQEVLVYSYEIAARSKNIENNQSVVTVVKYDFDGKHFRTEDISQFTVLGAEYLGGSNLSGNELNITINQNQGIINSDNRTENLLVNGNNNESGSNNLSENSLSENKSEKENFFTAVFRNKLILIIIVFILLVVLGALFYFRHYRKNKLQSQQQTQTQQPNQEENIQQAQQTIQQQNSQQAQQTIQQQDSQQAQQTIQQQDSQQAQQTTQAQDNPQTPLSNQQQGNQQVQQ